MRVLLLGVLLSLVGCSNPSFFGRGNVGACFKEDEVYFKVLARIVNEDSVHIQYERASLDSSFPLMIKMLEQGEFLTGLTNIDCNIYENYKRQAEKIELRERLAGVDNRLTILEHDISLLNKKKGK